MTVNDTIKQFIVAGGVAVFSGIIAGQIAVAQINIHIHYMKQKIAENSTNIVDNRGLIDGLRMSKKSISNSGKNG
jgi:hypothetical protein